MKYFLGSWLVCLAIAAQSFAAPPTTSPEKNIFDFTPDKTTNQTDTPPQTAAPATVPAPTTQPTPVPTVPVETPATQPTPTPEPDLTKPVLLTVPTVTQLAESRKLLNEVYADEIAAAKTPDKMLDLAEKMIETATDENTDHGAQYALLSTAQDLALKGMDLRLACRAIQLMGTQFDIDVLQQQATMAAAFHVITMPAADRRFYCLQVEALADKIASAGRFELLPSLDEAAQLVAATASDPALVMQLKKAAQDHLTAKSTAALIAAARKTLASDPTDGAANLTLGKYECFEQKDWTTGLPLLAASSDAKLKLVATNEIADDTSVAAADSWCDIAAAEIEPTKHRILAHAGDLYAAALPSLTGLEKLRVTKKLAEFKSTSINEPSAAVDLLDMLDPTRDAVAGTWTASSSVGTLTSDDGADSRIAVPYHPPREYDFRVVFTRLSGDNAIDEICIGGQTGRQFSYTVAGWDNTICGIDMVQANFADKNITGVHRQWLENGTRHTLVVHVRSDGVSAVLDDKSVGQKYATDYRDLGLHYKARLPRMDELGFKVFASKYLIHSAYIVEVSGHGQAVESKTSDESPIIATAMYSGPSNNHQPNPITLYANGRVDTSAPNRAIWYLRGSELIFRWGDNVDRCQLSSDRRSFKGKTLHGDAVKGQITLGSI